MLDIVLRHWDVLREAWSLETARKKRAKQYEEKDFLPAALEIMEKPPSPVGRAVFWGLIVFISIALIWSIFGRVDVVATAPGRLIPRERVKTIQPVEIGKVVAIHVTDGQAVKQGDVLIELDPSISNAEEGQARQSLMVASINAARQQALLDYLTTGTLEFNLPDSVPLGIALTQQKLIEASINEYEAQLAALMQQRAEGLADLAVVEREIAKLEQTLPLIEEQVNARAQLLEKGLTSRLLFLELRERFVTNQQNLAIQEKQHEKTQAALKSLDKQVEQLKSEFAKTVIIDLAEATNEETLRREELKKASTRTGLQKLIAPVDGVVQQLAVHTVGGVVQPAEPLMLIVPGDGELVVEATIFNKDIGFVNQGDPVEVKLEAFPFTKYGVIDGILEDVSKDAIQDEELGLIYQGRVKLMRSTIDVNGKEVNLSPGFAATAEIKTGNRRIIEFLIAPLLRYKDEAFRER